MNEIYGRALLFLIGATIAIGGGLLIGEWVFLIGGVMCVAAV